MTDKEFVLEAMQAQGLAQAKTLQAEAPELTGTELHARGGRAGGAAAPAL